jgi:hypothetical protein
LLHIKKYEKGTEKDSDMLAPAGAGMVTGLEVPPAITLEEVYT